MKGNLDEILNSLDPALARAIARHGVKLAIDLLQTLYADLTVEAKTPGRIGQPPKATTAVRVATGRSGWSDDPEERKREMARRMAVAKAKKKGKAQASAAKTRWQRMSAAERVRWQRAMQRGKEQHAKTESAA